MAKYRAGTLRDVDVLARNMQDIRRNIHEANLPSKTQTYGTSGKVGGETQDLSAIYQRLQQVENKLQALTNDVAEAKTKAEQARLSIGSVVYMNVKKEPAQYGTWTYLGATNIELTNEEVLTLHMYARTA